MIYTVEKWMFELDVWICRDELGNLHKLDLLTDCTFPEKDLPVDRILNDQEYKEYAISLVGLKLEIEETFPYISFGHNIKIVQCTR